MGVNCFPFLYIQTPDQPPQRPLLLLLLLVVVVCARVVVVVVVVRASARQCRYTAHCYCLLLLLTAIAYCYTAQLFRASALYTVQGW